MQESWIISLQWLTRAVLYSFCVDATIHHSGLSAQKSYMKAKAAGFIFLVSISFYFGCKKDKASADEIALYGTWVKGNNYGDTLWFMSKNGKNILRMAETFNITSPVYGEKEYRFRKGVLEIKQYSPTSDEYFPLTSFTWTDRGREFTIINSQLYIFLSSIITYTYRKI